MTNLAQNEISDHNEDQTSDDFPSLRFIRNKRIDAEMDMTPMVDVVFLLLIFFMITAAFGLQKSIEIPNDLQQDQNSQTSLLPKDQEKTLSDIVIHITKEDRIFVEDEEATTPQELHAQLREQRNQCPQHRINLLIQADAEATHDTVVRVLDAASGAGMESIRLMTNE